jgi:hypothetical protein
MWKELSKCLDDVLSNVWLNDNDFNSFLMHLFF